jgi:hypothetical protein
MKSEQFFFRPGFRLSVGSPIAGCGDGASRGREEGGPENNHRGADQWLFALEGSRP